MVGFGLACCRGVPAPSSVVGSINGKAGLEALVLIETAAMRSVQALIRRRVNPESTIYIRRCLRSVIPEPIAPTPSPTARSTSEINDRLHALMSEAVVR